MNKNTMRSIVHRALNRNKINARRRARYAEDAEFRAKTSEENKQYRIANRAKLNARRRQRQYGTDGTDMFEKQNGQCAICLCELELTYRKKNAAHLDHNHKTGEVRGWLCHACNTALGLFCDNSTLLTRAAEYLEKSR